MNFYVQENGLLGISEEKRGFSGERVSTGRDFNQEFVDTMTSQETQENSQVTHSPTNTKENELTLKRLAKSLFELQQPDSEASITHSLVNILNFLPMFLTSLQKKLHFTVLSLSTFFSPSISNFLFLNAAYQSRIGFGRLVNFFFFFSRENEL